MVHPSPSPPPSTWRDLPPEARVVVRRRLDADEARSTGKVWTDIIGIVLTVDDAGIRLRTDPPRGERREVFVPAAEVAAAKRIPPRPSPRGSGRPAGR